MRRKKKYFRSIFIFLYSRSPPRTRYPPAGGAVTTPGRTEGREPRPGVRANPAASTSSEVASQTTGIPAYRSTGQSGELTEWGSFNRLLRCRGSTNMDLSRDEEGATQDRSNAPITNTNDPEQVSYISTYYLFMISLEKLTFFDGLFSVLFLPARCF